MSIQLKICWWVSNPKVCRWVSNSRSADEYPTQSLQMGIQPKGCRWVSNSKSADEYPTQSSTADEYPTPIQQVSSFTASRPSEYSLPRRLMPTNLVASRVLGGSGLDQSTTVAAPVLQDNKIHDGSLLAWNTCKCHSGYHMGLQLILMSITLQFNRWVSHSKVCWWVSHSNSTDEADRALPIMPGASWSWTNV